MDWDLSREDLMTQAKEYIGRNFYYDAYEIFRKIIERYSLESLDDVEYFLYKDTLANVITEYALMIDDMKEKGEDKLAEETALEMKRYVRELHELGLKS